MTTIDLPMSVVDNMRNNSVHIDNKGAHRVKNLVLNDEASQNLSVIEKEADIDKGKGKEVTLVLNPIPRPPPPFSKD